MQFTLCFPHAVVFRVKCLYTDYVSVEASKGYLLLEDLDILLPIGLIPFDACSLLEARINDKTLYACHGVHKNRNKP
jgi:hypothetical protein